MTPTLPLGARITYMDDEHREIEHEATIIESNPPTAIQGWYTVTGDGDEPDIDESLITRLVSPPKTLEATRPQSQPTKRHTIEVQRLEDGRFRPTVYFCGGEAHALPACHSESQAMRAVALLIAEEYSSIGDLRLQPIRTAVRRPLKP